MKKKKKKCKPILVVAVVLALAALVWYDIRIGTALSVPSAETVAVPYSEAECLPKTVSVCYLTYGCELTRGVQGTVKEILDCNTLGIIQTNFGIVRTEKSDPATALLNTGDYVRSHIGDFRFLGESRGEKNGFYAAAFCDDEKQCVWVAYSGAITFADWGACIGLVAAPGLTGQEKSALAFYEQILQCDEIQKGYSLLLTGHSLGGALASMVSCASGAPAVTVNGADGLGVDKICAMLKHKPEQTKPDLTVIRNYCTSPTNGKVRLMDGVQRLMYLGAYRSVDYRPCKDNGLATDTHSVFSAIPWEN